MCNLPVYILIALKLLTFVNDHSTVLLNLTSLSLITLQYCFTPTHYASSYSFYSFYSPKSDTCKTCDTFVVKVDSEEDAAIKRRLSASWDLHKRKAERAYAVLKEDTALAQSDPKVDMITFDLQQSLPTPRISTGIVFLQKAIVDIQSWNTLLLIRAGFYACVGRKCGIPRSWILHHETPQED